MTADVVGIWSWIFDTFLRDGGLLVLLVCYAIGTYITKVSTKIDNVATVPILTLFGVFLVFCIPNFYPNDPYTVKIIKGALLGWSSTGLHEFLKAIVQMGILKIPGYELNDKKKSKDDDKKDSESESDDV